MASRSNSYKSDLRWNLRTLPNAAISESKLLDLVTILPERILNFLSYLRIYLVEKSPTIFDLSVKEDEVTHNFRQFFVDSLTLVLDPLFEGIWNLLTMRLNIAVRVTFIQKLREPLIPVVKALLDALNSLVPDALSSMVSIPDMSDTVVDTLLGTIADKAFGHYKKKIERHIFAEPEPLSKEEEEADQDKMRKDKEDKEKIEKEKKEFDNP